MVPPSEDIKSQTAAICTKHRSMMSNHFVNSGGDGSSRRGYKTQKVAICTKHRSMTSFHFVNSGGDGSSKRGYKTPKAVICTKYRSMTSYHFVNSGGEGSSKRGYKTPNSSDLNKAYIYDELSFCLFKTPRFFNINLELKHVSLHKYLCCFKKLFHPYFPKKLY